jgi:hypothetical protein
LAGGWILKFKLGDLVRADVGSVYANMEGIVASLIDKIYVIDCLWFCETELELVRSSIVRWQEVGF